MTKIGPVQLMAIGFDQTQGSRVRLWTSSPSSRTSRRSESSTSVRAQGRRTATSWPLTTRGGLGAIVGRCWLRVRGRRREQSPSRKRWRATLSGSQGRDRGMAASLAPGSSAGFLLVEHVGRATSSGRSARRRVPIGEGFLTPSWSPPSPSSRGYGRGPRRARAEEGDGA